MTNTKDKEDADLGGDYARDTHRGGFGDDYARDSVKQPADRIADDVDDRDAENIEEQPGKRGE